MNNPQHNFRYPQCRDMWILKLPLVLLIIALSGCDLFFMPSRIAHSVIYDGNGNTSGFAPADTAKYFENDAVAAAVAGSLARAGYVFEGWNTSADGTGNAYSAGALFSMPVVDLTLYATWTGSFHTVTFDSRGGSGVGAVRAHRIAEIPASARSGFALDGWYKDSECRLVDKVDFPYLPDADTTLYAKWIPASDGLLYVYTPEGYSVTKGMASARGTITVPEYWLGRSVTILGYAAFADCGGLEEVRLPEGLVLIGDRSFENCPSLLGISLPDSLKLVGAFAFADCTGLRAVSMPSGVTTIGDGAFSGCEALETFTFPSALRTVGARTFSNCIHLGSLDIPSGVDSLGIRAFSNCYRLKTLNIPDSVGSIGEGAFDGCEAVESLTIPSAVSVIADWTFFGCCALTSLVLPQATRSIGYAALADCTSLTRLIIPENVVSIGEYAISECDNLQTVDVYPAAVPAAGAHLFEDCDLLAEIRVPSSNIDAYKAATEWSAFSSIIVGR